MPHRQRVKSVTIRIALILTALILAACHGGPPGGSGGFPKPQPEITGLPYASSSFPTMATTLDADGDGGVSQQEIEAYLSQRFTFLDADGNGTVTRDEFRSAEERDKTLQRQKQEYLDRTFGRLDSDSDGQLTKQELLAGAAQRFMRTDLNGDGLLTSDDIISSEGSPQHNVRGGRGRGFGGQMGRGF